MKTEKNIFVAFILNLAFSMFEFLGGIITGSVAIISDAVHDIGDAASIGIAFLFERKSKKQPDEKYSYGYARYSVIGSTIMSLILVLGSVAVIYSAATRLVHPVKINYDGMIIFAIVGTAVNLIATFMMRHGDSLNQKAVNLHMLEDAFGWIVILVGAIVMRFTNAYIIDPITSIGISLFVIVNALKNLKEALDLLLEKTPKNISIEQIKHLVCHVDGVIEAHHIHVWSLDGHGIYATMHVVTDGYTPCIKSKVRDALRELGVHHATLEIENNDECCQEKYCLVKHESCHISHHHHH